MPDDVKQHQCVLILALQPFRPDLNSGGYALDRGTIMTMAKEIRRHAMDQNVKAIRLSVEPSGIQISIASRQPREH